MSKLMFVLLLMSLAMGCVPLARSTQSPPLAPPIAFDQSQRTTQTVVIEHAGQRHRMLCVLELGARGLVLVAFTELGQRLFTIAYGPEEFTIDTSPVLPSQFDPKRVLADLQLVYWPLDVYRKSLNKGWAIVESPSDAGRQLTHNGDVVAEVGRGADGTIEVRRPSLGYDMTIAAVPN